MIYCEQTFDAFREHATTDPENICVGETYYSNIYPTEFVVLKVFTDQQHAAYTNRAGPRRIYSKTEIANMDDEAPRWILARCERGDVLLSLHDRNCGDCYNPWMIFSDQQHAKDCENQLPVKFADSTYYRHEDYHDTYTWV